MLVEKRSDKSPVNITHSVFHAQSILMPCFSLKSVHSQFSFSSHKCVVKQKICEKTYFHWISPHCQLCQSMSIMTLLSCCSHSALCYPKCSPLAPKLCKAVSLWGLFPLRTDPLPLFLSSFFCVCCALCFCSNGKVQSLMLCVSLFPAKLLLFLLLLTQLTFLVCNRATLRLFGTLHKLLVFVWCVVSHFVMSNFHISSLWLAQTNHLCNTNSCFLLHINVWKLSKVG